MAVNGSTLVTGTQDQANISRCFVKPKDRARVGCTLLITFLALGIIATLAVIATVLHRPDIAFPIGYSILGIFTIFFVCWVANNLKVPKSHSRNIFDPMSLSSKNLRLKKRQKVCG